VAPAGALVLKPVEVEPEWVAAPAELLVLEPAAAERE
jgi:hypothetical protein